MSETRRSECAGLLFSPFILGKGGSFSENRKLCTVSGARNVRMGLREAMHRSIYF